MSNNARKNYDGVNSARGNTFQTQTPPKSSLPAHLAWLNKKSGGVGVTGYSSTIPSQVSNYNTNQVEFLGRNSVVSDGGEISAIRYAWGDIRHRQVSDEPLRARLEEQQAAREISRAAYYTGQLGMAGMFWPEHDLQVISEAIHSTWRIVQQWSGTRRWTPIPCIEEHLARRLRDNFTAFRSEYRTECSKKVHDMFRSAAASSPDPNSFWKMMYQDELILQDNPQDIVSGAGGEGRRGYKKYFAPIIIRYLAWLHGRNEGICANNMHVKILGWFDRVNEHTLMLTCMLILHAAKDGIQKTNLE